MLSIMGTSRATKDSHLPSLKESCMSEEIIVIEGNNHLKGEVVASGAKNSALKLIAAALLGQGKTILHNVPHISDISLMSQVLQGLGAMIVRKDNTLSVDTSLVDSIEAPYELVSQMRASIAVLGPLLGRFGKARVAMPGGCQIGARKIDMHLVGLEALGVCFSVNHGFLDAQAPDGLVGAHVVLDFPSVGATENLLMAAVCAKGTTVLENTAREPEIVDLANMLVDMGAHITGAGSSIIEVCGVALDKMHPCEHVVIGDRIEGGTFLVGGALTGGPVTLRGIDPAHLRVALIKLEAMGCEVTTGDDWVCVGRRRPLVPIDLQTLPHPGFPTDLQAQFMLLCAHATGTSVITENVFENRFMFASELKRMGAHITLEDHHALVRGVAGLQGADVLATDLRAGAALVLAGIAAQGQTRVHGVCHIDRGYEEYVGKLAHLGASLSRITLDDVSSGC